MGSCGLVMSLDELVQFSGNGAPAKLPDQFAGGVICGTLRVEEIPIPELARSHRVFPRPACRRLPRATAPRLRSQPGAKATLAFAQRPIERIGPKHIKRLDDNGII